jgi:hypothetical protein
MALGKCHFNWLRFLGLDIVLLTFLLTVINIGNTIVSLQYDFANTLPDGSPFNYVLVFGIFGIVLGSAMLSIEKKTE